ncbi:MAG TPA: Uma2 family endonuclease, partial [Urbifossiella sp.]
IVPDNMVFVHSKPIEAEGSYMLPVERVVPTLVLEYVSKSNERKDYQDNYKKYEQELQVPFYLVFHPENEDLRVFRLAGGEYLRLPPNSEGRFSIPDLELQAGLLDGWVRFWFRGELVPLPGDLMEEVDEQKRLRAEAELNALISKKALQSMERKKNEADRAKVIAEREKAAAEQAKAAAEQRALAAEAELARVLKELSNLKPTN